VSYLYNDGKPEELAAIAAHVQECEPCTRELAALGDTREQLTAWAPPTAELGFTLPSEAAVIEAPTPSWPPLSQLSSNSSNTPWWRQAAPVWVQAVAATVVFGAGMAIGGAGDGVAPAPAATTVARPEAAPVTRGELAALEQRIRELAGRAAAAPAVPVQTAQTRDGARDQELLKRMSTLIGDSEERQRSELALRTSQVLRDFEIQRKVDLATMQQAVGQIQQATGGELLQQRELYKRLMDNVSQREGAR
jgi:hypothetical protein